jgi:predicted aldo/keto reductase-like oxidoreductase
MRYRPLGRTGLEVSEIAFGAHGVDNPPLARAALDAGINTFCTSGQYLDGREEEALGQALRESGRAREGLVLFTGNEVRPAASARSVLDDIDASLRRLGTDYLDVYYAAMIQHPSELAIESFHDALEQAKRAGKVKHLGMSGHHGGMQDCLNAAIDDGRFDVFFIKYDFVSYPDQDAILRRAAEKGIGTVVFKTNAGNRQKEIKDLEAGGLSFRQATVKWALTNPYVSSVAVTFTNFRMVRELAAAAGTRPSVAELEMLRRYREEMRDKVCRFCGTCEATCPRGVAVADVMRYAMYFKYYGREKEAMRLYGNLARDGAADACASCEGPCDAACPFGRGVRAELVEAHQMLRFSQA